MLHAWEISKPHLGEKDKISESVQQTTYSFIMLYIQINSYFIEEKIIPHTGKLYALSNAAHPSCHVDTNLKLFDILGRLSLFGLWQYWLVKEFRQQEEFEKISTEFRKSINKYHDAIKNLIVNNPVLFCPCKDEQTIDIALTVLFLALEPQNHGDLRVWLMKMAYQIYRLFQIGGAYPCDLNRYHDLLEHPATNKDGYKEKVTQASILYPFIAAIAALFDFNDVYSVIQELKKDHLDHCNFQVWYPDDTSENHYYINSEIHGATLSQVPIDKSPQDFSDKIFRECNISGNFGKLSAIKYGFWPFILVASRHYRLPVPIDYFLPYWHSKC